MRAENFAVAHLPTPEEASQFAHHGRWGGFVSGPMRRSSGTSGRDASNRTIGSQTAADTHNLLHTIAAFREGARRLAAISDSSTRWAPPRSSRIEYGAVPIWCRHHRANAVALFVRFDF
jgi:hypothetical protein